MESVPLRTRLFMNFLRYRQTTHARQKNSLGRIFLQKKKKHATLHSSFAYQMTPDIVDLQGFKKKKRKHPFSNEFICHLKRCLGNTNSSIVVSNF